MADRYAIVTDGIYAETNPAGLPPDGYAAPAVVRGVITCDRLMVDLYADGVEIELVLAGLDPVTPQSELDTASGKRRLTAAAAVARDRVEAMIASARGLKHHVFLPRPRHVAGWLPSIRAGSRHAGVLFLSGDSASLNARIAAAKLSRIDKECAYLSPHWNQPRAAA